MRRFGWIARLARVGHREPIGLKVREDLVYPAVCIDLDDLSLQSITLQRRVQRIVEEFRQLGQIRPAVGRRKPCGRQTDVRNIDDHDVCGAVLDNLPDKLRQSGRRSLYSRRGGLQ